MKEPKDTESSYSLKFRIMLQVIPHPDGGYWTGTKMKLATNDVVSASYFTLLRNGGIDIPRADKIEAIANAMGFTPDLWFRDLAWWQDVYERWKRGDDVEAHIHSPQGAGDSKPRMVELVNQLFEERVNKDTGEPFTDAEVAEQSSDALSPEEVAALRSGTLDNPTWNQLLSLCSIFGVGLAYFNGSEPPVLHTEGVTFSADDDDQESYITFRNSVAMTKQDRSLLRSMSDHLKRQRSHDHSHDRSPGEL